MALSTIKVKDISIIEIAKEALWLRKLIVEMGVEKSIVILHNNSQSTL